MSALGHILDSNTILLWRFDELISSTYSGDEASGCVIQWFNTGTSQTGKIGRCRELSGSNQYGQGITGHSTTAIRNAFLGACTFECWIWTDSTAVLRTIFAVTSAALSENEADNYLFSVRMIAGGKLEALWETGPGTNVAPTQTTGSGLSTGAWHHIAVVKKAGTGGLYDVEYYLNGALQQTVTGNTNASGGGLAEIFIGRNGPFGDADWDGKIDEIRVSSVARSASEILASYLRGTDVGAPAIAANSPSAGSTLSSDSASISLDVTDSSGIAAPVVVASFSDGGPPEMVYSGASFASGYSGSVTDITDGKRITFTRTAGWRRPNPTFSHFSRDALGNSADGSSTVAYVFTPPDYDVDPVIANMSPSAGTTISTDTAIAFDTTDDHGFRRIFVLAKYSLLGRWEVIHNGTSFSPQYDAASTRSPISGGYHYSVKRDTGWPEPPTIEIFPIDSTGQETA